MDSGGGSASRAGCGGGIKLLRGLRRLWLDRSRYKADASGFRGRIGAGRNSMGRQRLHIYYSGCVQGVGFRYTARRLAMGFEVTGVVRNLPDGRVELVAEGERAELEAFQRAIQDSELGHFVRQEQARWEAATNEYRGFEIVA